MADDFSDDIKDLIAIRNELKTATEQLLEERFAAMDANDAAKKAAAEAEFDKLKPVIAAVQAMISGVQAAELNKLAALLSERIAAQRAVGLSTAVKTLEGVVARLPSDGETATG